MATTRSYAELAALGTYQGMTDEEIELVIDTRVGLARNEATLEALRSREIELLQARTIATEQLTAAALDSLREQTIRPLVLQEVRINES